jgi:hypothetical protein
MKFGMTAVNILYKPKYRGRAHAANFPSDFDIRLKAKYATDDIMATMMAKNKSSNTPRHKEK